MAETRRKCATPRVRSGPTVIASTSTAVLDWPSLPTYGRTSSFPLTSTGSPLRRHTFRFSASLRQHVTFTPDVLPSTHSPVAESLRRVVQTTRIDSLGTLAPTIRYWGSLATLPERITCASLNITNLLNLAAPTLVALGLPLWRLRAARLRTTIAGPQAAAGPAVRACGRARATSPVCEQPRETVRTVWE